MKQRVLIKRAWLLALPCRFRLDGGHIVTIGQEPTYSIEGALVGDVAILLVQVDYHNPSSFE